MPRFRPAAAYRFDGDKPAPSGADLSRLLEEVIGPANFFAPTLSLGCRHRAEESAWEVFQGRLLDPAHTRATKSFESFSLHTITKRTISTESLLSLKLDREAGAVHVLRSIYSYAWEGYDSGGNVYLSREVHKWVRELVGTVKLSEFSSQCDLRDELACQLFHAVVGTSRLPLASVETPLPQFSFGEIFYCYRPDAGRLDGQLRTHRDLVTRMLTGQTAWTERSRLLETLLHAVPFAEMESAVGLFVRRWRDLGETAADLAGLLRTLFNEVSLSPYTDLVDKTLAFVRALEAHGYFTAAAALDFLGYLLRQNGRHLTAYDLVTFHHRGSNYPDALLLDAVLKDYLTRIEQQPDLFTALDRDDAVVRESKRRRRRALRQGYLLRRRYENHPVPDLPTSPGENTRVLPPGYPRVPDEQLAQPGRRTKRLFAGGSLSLYLTAKAATVLKESIADLDHADELRELGMALFLDRPFGTGKAPAEPDATLLLSAEAFSRFVADGRLRFLQALDLLTAEQCEAQGQRLRELEIKGLPLDAVGAPPRLGVIALSDARQAAPDFVFLRTTSATLRELFEQYDFTPLRERFRLEFLTRPRDLLLARAADGDSLILYDEKTRPRLELLVDANLGYQRRAGREWPIAGFRARRVGGDSEGVVIRNRRDGE